MKRIFDRNNHLENEGRTIFIFYKTKFLIQNYIHKIIILY